MQKRREVQLRSERFGCDHRFLWAHLDGDGNLRFNGQFLDVGTVPVSSNNGIGDRTS